MIDELQELEAKQSITSVQNVEGFTFKTTLYHGVRNFELVDEKRDGGEKRPQSSRIDDDSLDFSNLEGKTQFLKDPSRYTR